MKFWFGWLIKGKCEVSLLDVIICIGEFAVLAIVVTFAIAYFKRDTKQDGTRV